MSTWNAASHRRPDPAIKRVAGLVDDDLGTLNLLLAHLDAKRYRNLLRAAYYDAKRSLKQSSPVVPPMYERLGIVLGWSAKAVDLLVRRCNLEGFIWPDGDLDDLGWREVWDGNMLGSEVNQALTSSAIHASAFVVTTEGRGDDPAAVISFKSALDATGEWDARARRLKDFVSVLTRDEDSRPDQLAFYLDGMTVTIAHEPTATQSPDWRVLDVQEHPWGVPADTLPYRPRLGRPFGSSRISRPVMSLQDQAVRELVRLEGHMDVYSYPEMWMLGADESIFKNADGSQKAAWQVMLGRIKGIPDDDEADHPRADIKSIPAASPEPHLAGLNTFAKLFARETALPDTALAITDFANPTSAESYDASQYELIAEAEGAIADWAPLRRSFIRALAIANNEPEIPAEWASIDAKWRNPRYLSRAAQADAGVKQLAAVPWLAETEVGLELIGLDAQQQRRAMSERTRATGRNAIEVIRAAVTQTEEQTQETPEENVNGAPDAGGPPPTP